MATRLRTDSNLNVAYADTDADSHVSIDGTAALSTDRAKLAQLWLPLAKAWFTGCVGDPDLLLLEVKITHAEYWNVKASKVTQLFKMAKAASAANHPAACTSTKSFASPDATTDWTPCLLFH